MKKIIILSFVVTAMIILGMNVNSSARVRNMNSGTSQNYIQYQVNIHANWAIRHNQCPMIVEITDGPDGKVIQQPMLYQQGINTYYFTEVGPVHGTRVAHLLNLSSDQPGNVCITISVSDTKSGVFYDGSNYIFDVFGSTKDIFKQDNSRIRY